MYEAFFGLRERPFDLTPNPRFLCMTPSHREALSTIQYGIASRKGLTLLVGPAGSGKTTLVRAALERQPGATIKVGCLNNPLISREEFFEFLADEFAVPSGAVFSKTRFMAGLQAALLARHEQGLSTALIIDEAQTLSDDLLEEVRLLENFETDSDKLLPVVLVAHTEFAERLKQPALQHLRQRIALRASLAALTPHDTGLYVAERLRIAGGDVRGIFTPEAVAAVAEAAGGIPRMVSVLCDNALVSGFALDQRPVGVEIIGEVCRDFELPVPRVVASLRPSAPRVAPPPPAPVMQPQAPPPVAPVPVAAAAAASQNWTALEEPVFAMPAAYSNAPEFGETGLTVRPSAFTTTFDLAEMAETTMSHLTMPTVAGLETLVIDPPPPEPSHQKPTLSQRMRGLGARFSRKKDA